MDNLEDRNDHRQDSAARGHRDPADPIVQAGDYSGKGQKAHGRASSVSRVAPTAVLPESHSLVPATAAVMGTHTFTGDSASFPSAPSITDTVRSTLRFKWTIVVIFVLLAAPTIAAIWTQMTLKYRARAEIRISPIVHPVVFKTEDTGLMPLYDSYVNTQVSVIKSPKVLVRVLERKDVQETQWYKNPKPSLMERIRGDRIPLIERLVDALTVRPRFKTEIVDVRMEDTVAEDAKVIVQAVVEEYERYAGSQSDEARDELYGRLSNQYLRLQKEVYDWEEICFRLQEELGTVDPDVLLSSRAAAIDEGQAALDAIRQEIIKVQMQIEKAGGVDPNAETESEVAQDPTSQPKYYTDSKWSRLDEAVQMARHAIDVSPLKPTHPGWLTLERDLELAEKLLREREEQLDEQWHLTRTLSALASDPNSLTPQQQLEYSQNRLEILREQARVMEQDLTKKQEDYNRLFAKSQELKRETATLQHKRGLFQQVQARKDAKDMEKNITGRISVLAPAAASFTPYNDRRVLFTGMALVMSMGVAGGVAFLRASLNQTIRRSQDMPRAMHIPFLGNVFVPEISSGRSGGKSLYDKVQQRRLRLIESVRIVRTSLLSRLEGQDSTSAVITSAGAGTGKTTLAVMLGKSLAQAGKKVLLIDADFYKTTLTKRFALSEEAGLRETLRAQNKCKCPIFQTETRGLSIMPAGKPTDNEIVFDQTANGAFRACINRLQKQYDIILVDSPPVLPVADAAILSNKVDGVIMVERELISRREEVVRAIARLSSAGGRFLGTVFMGPADRKEYYGVGYDYSRASNA